MALGYDWIFENPLEYPECLYCIYTGRDVVITCDRDDEFTNLFPFYDIHVASMSTIYHFPGKEIAACYCSNLATDTIIWKTVIRVHSFDSHCGYYCRSQISDIDIM